MLLTVNRCPRHGFIAIGVDNSDGTGERLTPSKCCGQWETVKSWGLSAEDWERIAKIARRGARDARKAAKKLEAPAKKKAPIRKKAAGRRRGRR